MKTRTKEQLLRDRALMERLGEFAPREELGAKVRAFYERAARCELAASMANPKSIVRDALEALAKADPVRARELNPSALVEAVETNLRAAVNPIPDDLVEAEVQTAHDEILRTWVNALNLAWRLRQDGAGEVELLPSTLHPNPTKLRDGERWKRRRVAALKSLRSAVALAQGGDDLSELTGAFCRKALASLPAQPIALPDGLEIAKVGTRIVLRSR